MSCLVLNRAQVAREIQLLGDVCAEYRAAGLEVPKILREGLADAQWMWTHPGKIPPTSVRALQHWSKRKERRRQPLRIPAQRRPERVAVVR